MSNSIEQDEASGATLGQAQHSAELATRGATYTYVNAGIAEREGQVPVWLWYVVAALLVWGMYYLVTYWNAPVSLG